MGTHHRATEDAEDTEGWWRIFEERNRIHAKT